MRLRERLIVGLLNQAPLLLFVLLCLILGGYSERFISAQNWINILTQSSSLAITAIGMTMVLLTAGVDLSVGSVMFLSVAVAGKLILEMHSLPLSMAAGAVVGALAGLINGMIIVRLRVIPFIATLAMLFILRGSGLWLTNTRAMNMPDAVTALGAAKWLGMPVPILAMIVVALAAQWLLWYTPTGRHIYAIGHDREAGRKAGLPVSRILLAVYVICGLCAAVGGLVALSQTGAVSPSFGSQREFAAIAAAVLGGTSLFGGRGSILPGTIFGAILFQTVENGLVILNADPYLYPLIISFVIFIAVLIDTSKKRLIERLSRRRIRTETVSK